MSKPREYNIARHLRALIIRSELPKYVRAPSDDALRVGGLREMFSTPRVERSE